VPLIKEENNLLVYLKISKFVGAGCYQQPVIIQMKKELLAVTSSQ